MLTLTTLQLSAALVLPNIPPALVLPAVNRCPPIRLSAATEDEAKKQWLEKADHDGWEGTDWAAFEAWQSEQQQSRLVHNEERGRYRWTATSAGHQHDHFFSNRAHDFAALGASPRLVSNLAALGLTRPSIAQSDSFKSIATGKNIVLHHASGTGKTLAFVAPLVERLWEWEAEYGRTPAGQVRAIVIVPTPELGQQVLELAREVSSRSIRASIATGDHSWASQRKRLNSGLELLVATMGRLVAHLDPRDDAEPSFNLDGIRALIVDEADSLYQGEAPSWLQHRRGGPAHGMHQEPPLAMWKWMLQELPDTCATTFLTASLSPSIEKQMASDVYRWGPAGDLKTIAGRGVHTTRPGVKLTLVDCSKGEVMEDGHESLFEAKLDELLKLLVNDEDEKGGGERTLILVNSAATCDRLVRSLHRKLSSVPDQPYGRILRFHSSLSPEQKRASLDAFKDACPKWPNNENNNKRGGGRKGKGMMREEEEERAAKDEPPRIRKPDIFIATGRASKGLSFGEPPSSALGAAAGEADGASDAGAAAEEASRIGHVVLFEFPPDVKAYIARVGFATRGNQRPSRVTALAVGKQLPFAKAMMKQAQEGAVHRLD